MSYLASDKKTSLEIAFSDIINLESNDPKNAIMLSVYINI